MQVASRPLWKAMGSSQGASGPGRIFVLATALVLVALSCAAVVQGQPTGNRDHPLPRVDRLVARKAAHELEAWSGGRLVRTYRVAIGAGGAGPKAFEGDGRTPEGRYSIDSRHRSSSFHRFLHISYPNAEDRRRHREARRRGQVPRGRGIGGDVGIHGEARGIAGIFAPLVDWTAGCIAVSDEEIEELYAAVRPGAPIEILP